MIEVVVDKGDLLKLDQALNDLEARNLIQPQLEPYAKMVLEEATPYPPQGSNARYERTNNLAESWSRSIMPLQVEVKNAAEYAGWVVARNPRHKIGTKRKMGMTWKFGWKDTYSIMLNKMDEWIVMMEHKAFNLWER